MNVERMFGAAILVTGVSILALISWVLVSSIAASGRVEFCYVESHNASDFPIYRLYGWRDWREDNVIGSYPNLEAAVAASRSMDCPLTMEGARER